MKRYAPTYACPYNNLEMISNLDEAHIGKAS